MSEFPKYTNEQYQELESKLEAAEREKLDLMLKQEQMLLQVKNRMPIEISEKVDSWPRCLSAVSQLKQERNNADVDLAVANKKIDSLNKTASLQYQIISESSPTMKGMELSRQLAKHNNG